MTGATGGVGKRVVQLLLQKGRHVRALVRDVDKARTLLVRNLPAACFVVPFWACPVQRFYCTVRWQGLSGPTRLSRRRPAHSARTGQHQWRFRV